jgi:hypothetical protein
MTEIDFYLMASIVELSKIKYNAELNERKINSFINKLSTFDKIMHIGPINSWEHR